MKPLMGFIHILGPITVHPRDSENESFRTPFDLIGQTNKCSFEVRHEQRTKCMECGWGQNLGANV